MKAKNDRIKEMVNVEKEEKKLKEKWMWILIDK